MAKAAGMTSTSTSTNPAATAAETAPAETGGGADNPTTTRLDSDVTKPSTTAPGDGPADTTDPTEQASTVGGDKAAAAAAGHLTVNAVVPIEGNPPAAKAFSGKGRIEKYPATRADGTVVEVTHNIDTGETSIA